VLRLLSYNIRSLRDDPAAVRRVIRAARPHVVCIQEAPRFLRWRTKCASLARDCGLVVVSGGRPAAANLLLSSLSVDVLFTRDLRFSRQRWFDVRGTSIALLRKSGHTFAVAGVDLGRAADARLRHAAELHAAVDRDVPADVPAIIAGDVNDRPDSAVWRVLGARGTDVWTVVGHGYGFTHSATNPFERIDAVFADPRLRICAARVPDDADVRAGSDHRPLLVEFDLG
jgi:endonuclease/exonuclease/phosphatase family metal-dependent hydrolase